MHYVASMKHFQTLDNRSTYAPNLFLLNDSFVGLCFPDQVSQEVPLGRILHDQIEIPVTMFILLEKAVIQFHKVRRWQLLQKECLLLHLQFHIVCDILAHEDSFERNLDRHFTGFSEILVDESHQINMAEAT